MKSIAERRFNIVSGVGDPDAPLLPKLPGPKSSTGSSLRPPTPQADPPEGGLATPEITEMLRAEGYSDEDIYEVSKPTIALRKREGYSEGEARESVGLDHGPQAEPSAGLLERLAAGRVIDKIIDGLGEGWGKGPVGFDGEGEMEELMYKMGILSKDPAPGPFRPLQMAQERAVKGSFALVEGAFRALAGGFIGGASGLAGVITEATDAAGVAKSHSNKGLARDLLAVFDSVGITAGTTAISALKGNAGYYKTVKGADGRYRKSPVSDSLPRQAEFTETADLIHPSVTARTEVIIRDLYNDKGILPSEVLADAASDITIKQDILLGRSPRAYGGKALPDHLDGVTAETLDNMNFDTGLRQILEAESASGAPVDLPGLGNKTAAIAELKRRYPELDAKNIPEGGVIPGHLKFANGKEITADNLRDLDYDTGLADVASASGISFKFNENANLQAWIIQKRLADKYPHLVKPVLDPADLRGLRDTRTEGNIYHGTSKAIPEGILREGHYASLNYYGNGFYASNAADVAVGYSKARRAKDPTLYQVTEKTPSRLYDMESPLTPEMRTKLGKVGDTEDLIEYALNSGAKNMREIFDEIRDNSFGAGVPADEVQNIFESIQDMLKADGFTGMRHKGGLRTKVPEHDVSIYFNPETDLTITKVDPASLRRPDVAPEAGASAGAAQTPGAHTPTITTLEEAHAHIASRIIARADVPTSRTPTMDILHNAYTMFVDSMHPIKRRVKEMTKSGAPVPGSFSDPRVLSQLLTGSYGRAEHFITLGTFDFHTLARTSNRGLKQILEGVDDLAEFERYAVARAAVDRARQGKESGIAADAARIVLTEQGAKYATPFNNMVKLQNDVLHYLKQSGVIDDATEAALIAHQKDYLPMYRLMGDEDLPSNPSIGGKTGNVENPLKKISKYGSERIILSPLESVVMNIHALVNVAERNRAWNSYITLAEQTDNPGRFFQRVPPSVSKTTATAAETKAILEQLGVPDAQPGVLEFFRPMVKAAEKDEIIVFRNGKRQVYKVDRDVASVVQGMDEKTLNLALRILAVPSRTQRAGIVLQPLFIAKQLLRDQWVGAIQEGMVPVVDNLIGVVALGGDNATKSAWLRSGGAGGSLAQMDKRFLGNNIPNNIQRTGTLRGIWNSGTHPLQTMRNIQQAVDESTRLGIYNRRAKGSTDANVMTKAALSSREVTLDYARRGSHMKVYNAITTFAASRIGGMDRTVRALIDHPVKSSLVATATITIPEVYLWSVNHNNPIYRDLPGWQRDGFFNLIIGEGEGMTEERWTELGPEGQQEVMANTYVIPVPGPFEWKILFGATATRTLDALYAEDPKAVQGIVDAVSATLFDNLMPAAATAPFEHAINEKSLTGAPVLNKSIVDGLPAYQKQPYTSPAAVAMADLFRVIPALDRIATNATDGGLGGGVAKTLVSPVLIQHYVESWGGTLGRQALRLASEMLIAAGISPEAPMPNLNDNMFVAAIVMQNPARSSHYVGRMYDEVLPYQKTYNTYKNLEKLAEASLDYAEFDKFEEKHAGEIALWEELNDYTKTVTEIRTVINATLLDSTMTDPEKRQLTEIQYLYIVEVAKDTLRRIEEFENQDEYDDADFDAPSPYLPPGSSQQPASNPQ